MNSINLLLNSASHSSLSLFSNPAHSLYCWILSLHHSLQRPITFSHIRAHTSTHSVPLDLNRLVDHLASQSYHHHWAPPAVPVPTFTMDEYTPYSPLMGFFESSLGAHVDNLAAIEQSKHLQYHWHAPVLSSLYYCHAPAEYPYTWACSAYSAVIQLYGRSHQLNTALSRHNRLHDHMQPWCQMGCTIYETTHHIFIACPVFIPWREAAAKQLIGCVQSIFDAQMLNLADAPQFSTWLGCFASDSQFWPRGRSQYYLSLIPPLLDVALPPTLQASSLKAQQLLTRITNECHIAAILLAGRIWGDVCRRCSPFPNTSSFSKSPNIISLPANMSFIHPSSSAQVSISYN
jgi:hypothetical protein